MKAKCACGPVENRGVGNHQSWCPVREAQRLDSRIRVGDMVRVVNAERVVRVGYPRCLDDYRKEVMEGHRDELVSLVRRVCDKPLLFLGPGCRRYVARTEAFLGPGNERALEEIVGALAYRLATKNQWGGSERSVHTEPAPGWKGCTSKVLLKVFARIGVRQSGYGPEDDYEPPCLVNPKTVVLCCLGYTALASPDDKTFHPIKPWRPPAVGDRRRGSSDFRDSLWFRADCLEKVLEDGH